VVASALWYLAIRRFARAIAGIAQRDQQSVDELARLNPDPIFRL
jgi:hypothetical protein